MDISSSLAVPESKYSVWTDVEMLILTFHFCSLLAKADGDATAHFKDLCQHSSEYKELCAAAGVPSQ